MPLGPQPHARSISTHLKASDEARASLRISALRDAKADVSFVFLVLASSAIATFGLLEESTAAIIGAMIVAPLLRPIRAMAFGAVAGSLYIFMRAMGTLTLGIILPLLLSAGVEKVIRFAQFGAEVVSRSQPTLLDLGIAIVAGSVAGFAAIRPEIADSIAGTAVAVALMPPLCVVGLAFAHGNFHLGTGAMLLFATNLLGISLACMVVFLLTGHVDHVRARTALIGTFVVTLALAVPLAQSLRILVHEARLEVSLRNALADTVTFRRAELSSARFDWHVFPPHVTLRIRSDGAVTPHQVQLLEEHAQRVTGQRFRLTLGVTLINRVEAAEPLPNPSPTGSFLNEDASS